MALPSKLNDCSSIADVVVVNESKAYFEPGDVMIFRSAERAAAYLEPWWVEDGEGYALSGVGLPVTLRILQGQVLVQIERAAEPDLKTPRLWLFGAANAVRAAREHNQKQVPVGDEIPSESTADLINYIGFNGSGL